VVPFHLLLAAHASVRVQASHPRQRFGDGPIPVNTLYTEPQALFADPLHAPASASKLATTGVNHDTLMLAGWLDLSKGPQVLHVPDMAGRYYSVQFTDPSKNTVFCLRRKTRQGTEAGEIPDQRSRLEWIHTAGMAQIFFAKNSVLVFGRTLVESDRDLPAAYALSKADPAHTIEPMETRPLTFFPE